MKVEITGLGRKQSKSQRSIDLYNMPYSDANLTIKGLNVAPNTLVTKDGTKMKVNENDHITEITFPNGVELEMTYDENMMLTVKVTGHIVETYEEDNGKSMICYIDEEIE